MESNQEDDRKCGHLNLGRCKRGLPTQLRLLTYHTLEYEVFSVCSVVVFTLATLFLIMNLKIIPNETFFANNDASFLLAKNILIYEMNYMFTNQTVIFR